MCIYVKKLSLCVNIMQDLEGSCCISSTLANLNNGLLIKYLENNCKSELSLRATTTTCAESYDTV